MILRFPLLTSSTSHSAERHLLTLLTPYHPEGLDFIHTKNQRASLSANKLPEGLKSSRNSEPFIKRTSKSAGKKNCFGICCSILLLHIALSSEDVKEFSLHCRQAGDAFVKYSLPLLQNMGVLPISHALSFPAQDGNEHKRRTKIELMGLSTTRNKMMTGILTAQCLVTPSTSPRCQRISYFYQKETVEMGAYLDTCSRN